MEDLEKLFEKQGEKRWEIAATGAAERIAKLKKLRAAIVARQDELYKAVWEDYHKPEAEVWTTELLPSILELDHTVKGLRGWMKDRPCAGTVILPLAKSRVHYEPKGRVLIMSPWNYPFQLFMAPLISAVAAGNVIIAKPSNKTPCTSAFLADLIASLFDPDEVAVVEGPGSILGEKLLELPFDHIFFTGSPKIGAHVGEAAQRMHAGLTLELGGKSPAILLADADLEDAAKKLAWGKCLNAGQTCIAPDYLFCPRTLMDSFAARVQFYIEAMYGKAEEERFNSKDLVHIVDTKAAARLAGLIEDATKKGARLVMGGSADIEGRRISPTILTGVKPDMAVMSEEIFGPILPVLAYDSIDDAIEYIHAHPKPLALYVFGKASPALNSVIARTTSGSACINDTIVQIENLNAPFGGIGMSGTGNYHGFYGFKTFSHERNVMRQGPTNMTRLLYPPYGLSGQNKVRAIVKDYYRIDKQRLS